MWGNLILTCALLFSMTACGSSPSVHPSAAAPSQLSKPPIGTESPIQQLRREAEKGNAEAQFVLAQAYDRGRGVPQDQAEAVRWYRQAAEQGDAFSQFILGNKYWKGSGISKNEQEAIRWWHNAAAQGYAPAQNSLGQALANGSKTVPQEKVQAYMWLTLSAKQGDQEADQQRTVLSKQLKQSQLKKAMALVKAWKPTKPQAFVSKNTP